MALYKMATTTVKNDAHNNGKLQQSTMVKAMATATINIAMHSILGNNSCKSNNANLKTATINHWPR